MKKMSNFLNALLFVTLLLSTDFIICSKESLKMKAHLKLQTKTTQTPPSSTSSKNRIAQSDTSSRKFVTNNPHVIKINNLDLAGTTVVNDPNKSKLNIASTYSACKEKFYNLISSLPDDIQKAILSEFANNTTTNACCDADKLIKSVSIYLNNQVKSFANIITDQTRSSKKGFACFRSAEIVAKDQNLPIDSSFTNKNKEFINKLLLDENVLSSNLLKCLAQINKISIRNIGLMCSTNDLIDKLFSKDNLSGKITSIKKFQEDDKNIYTDCINYIKNYDTFSNTVLGAYIDSLNTLIGTDKCNYFSNLFFLDPIKDKNDPFMEKTLTTTYSQNLQQEQTLLNDSSLNNSNTSTNAPNNSNNDTKTPDTLLNIWKTCASTKSEFNSNLISELATSVQRAQFINPYGLSTYIGRADINYQAVKQKFNLVNQPYYYLRCTLTEGCYAGYKNLNYSKQSDMNNIVTGLQTRLEVSCCNFICIVYVKIEDVINTTDLLSSSQRKILEGAEIFEMKSDRNVISLSPLDLLEMRNARNCFNQNSTTPISFAELNTQQIPNSPSASTTTTSSTDKQFNNLNFIRIFNDIYNNPTNYENDFRLKTNTLLKVTFNNSEQTINDLVYNNLFKSSSNNFLSCENGICNLYDSVNFDSSSKVLPNTDRIIPETPITMNSSIAKKTTGASSKSSSSKGSSFSGIKSSSSSSSKGSSSSSSIGSSFNPTKSSSGSSSSSSSGSSFNPTKSSSGSSSSSSSGSSFNPTKSSSGSSSSRNSFIPSSTTFNPSSGSRNSSFFSSGSNSIGTNSSGKNTSNYNMGKSTNNSQYASKINISNNPNSFNNNYYTTLYKNNAGYDKLKYKSTQSFNSFSSYPNSYSTYNSNSYISSLKIKDNKLKIKIKYYPSYTYNPLYSNVFYNYNRYNYYDDYYNPYYWRPNYYYYYYQNRNSYINNPAYTNYSFNSLNLNPEFNAEDWLPSYQPYFDREGYVTKLNSNLSSVKIYSQCCQTFCAIVIQNNDDGLYPQTAGKYRVYVEVYLRNYAFFDSSILSASQKKCLIKNINDNSNQINSNLAKNISNDYARTNDIFTKCGIKSPYDVVPIKQTCLNEMQNHCKNSGFSELMDASAIYVKSSDSTDSECSAPDECLTLPDNPTEQQMSNCGSNIYSIFSLNYLKPKFSGFIYPCKNSNEVSTTSSRIAAMIQLKNQQNLPVSNGSYVNLNDLSPAQKLKLENVEILAANQVNNSIAIDNNLAGNPNTNTSVDLNLVNSSTDQIVNASDTQTNKGNTSSSNYINKYSLIKALILTLVCLFI